MKEYSIPVVETKEGPILDVFSLEYRDNTRENFSPDEKAIIEKMKNDAIKCFEALEDKHRIQIFC
jgi:hypothetical protein